MRKRKPKDNPERNWLGLGLAGGVLTLVVLSVAAAALWFANRPTAAPRPVLPVAIPTQTPIRVIVRATTTPLPPPTPFPTPTMVRPLLNRLPADGYVVYSTNMLEIGAIDGDGVRPMSIRGADVAATPDGETLAYIREGRLYLYQNETETRIDVPGTPRMPAWNADGTALAFVVRKDNQDTVYRLRRDRTEALPVLSVKELAAPPLSSPSENRLLITEVIMSRSTRFYTIDPLCMSTAACQASREDIATVPYAVSWAAYHPSGTFIAFTERDNGGLYALKTGSKEVMPLISDQVYKRRVAFGRDPGKLIVIDGENNLYLLDLTNLAWTWLSPSNVTSVRWAGG
jgi:hypothetical protein